MNDKEKLDLAIYTLVWARDALFGSGLSKGEICNSIQSILNKISECEVE